jgi:hypothetical protein
MEKLRTNVEKARHEMEMKEEVLERKHDELIKREEDLKLSKEKIEHEIESLEDEKKKIKADLREKARMDYRLDKRKQELRIEEAKIKQMQTAIAKREETLKAREEEAAASGAIDTGRLDEVFKMKSLELARKEELLKAQEDDIDQMKKAYEQKLKLLEEEGKAVMDGDTQSLAEKLRVREKDMDRKEDELRKLEHSLREKWSKLQMEIRKVSEAKAGAPMAEGSTDLKPLLKVKCVGCQDLIPIYSTSRPLKVKCPKCGSVGVLR